MTAGYAAEKIEQAHDGRRHCPGAVRLTEDFGYESKLEKRTGNGTGRLHGGFRSDRLRKRKRTGCCGSGGCAGRRGDPAGLVNFFLRYQQAEFESSYGAWLQSYYGTDIWNVDLSGTGTSYGETFKNDVINSLERLLLAEKHMGDYSVELTDEEKTAITQAAQEFMESNEEEVLEKMSATQENAERLLTLYTIQNKMETQMSADVDTEVSDEEAAQRTVSYVRFTAETESDTEEAEAEEETETGSESETEAAAEAETEAAETENETAPAEDATEASLTEAAADKTESADTEEATEGAETEAVSEEETEAAGTEADQRGVH